MKYRIDYQKQGENYYAYEIPYSYDRKLKKNVKTGKKKYLGKAIKNEKGEWAILPKRLSSIHEALNLKWKAILSKALLDENQRLDIDFFKDVILQLILFGDRRNVISDKVSFYDKLMNYNDSDFYNIYILDLSVTLYQSQKRNLFIPSDIDKILRIAGTNIYKYFFIYTYEHFINNKDVSKRIANHSIIICNSDLELIDLIKKLLPQNEINVVFNKSQTHRQYGSAFKYQKAKSINCIKLDIGKKNYFAYSINNRIVIEIETVIESILLKLLYNHINSTLQPNLRENEKDYFNNISILFLRILFPQIDKMIDILGNINLKNIL